MGNGSRGIEALRANYDSARASGAAVRPGRLIGVLALVSALVTVVLTVSGVAAALDGDYGLSVTLGYVAAGVSVLGMLLGLAALVTGGGRLFGLVGLVLSALANPLVLEALLGYASGLG